MHTPARLGSLLAAIVMMCSGCGPAPQPVWNHDSRSFFFTHVDGSVVQYDLEKAASRTLTGPGHQRPRQVALSPKLPFIAFASTSLGPDSRAAQVGLASLVSGKTGWQKVQSWGNSDGKRDVCPSLCHWCPTGQRILVWYQQSAAIPGLIQSATPFGGFAVVDIKNQTLSELKGTPPAAILCQALHVSPIAGDGSGYLGMKLAESTPTFVFVDWDGWESPLTVSEEVAALIQKVGDPQSPRDNLMDTCFPLPQGAWDGTVLKFAIRKGVIVIDVKARRITCEPLSESQQQNFEGVSKADSNDAPWKTLQVALFTAANRSLHYRMHMGGERTGRVRIELVDHSQDRRREVLTGLAPENFLVHHLFPSPDGKRILACLMDTRFKSFTIHVVESDGTISAQLETGVIGPVEGKP